MDQQDGPEKGRDMTMGHNGAPPIDAISLHVEDLFALISDTLAGGEVTTDAQDAALDELLDEFRKARKDAETERATEKKPFLDGGKAVDEAWRPILSRCDMASAAIKDAVTPFRDARQRAKDEAVRITREEATARQEAAQDAIRGSDDLETRFNAEAELKAAGKLVAASTKASREATGLRTYWQAEIVFPRAALAHYLEREADQFAALVQSLADRDARGTRAPVPGVAFVEKKRAV